MKSFLNFFFLDVICVRVSHFVWIALQSTSIHVQIVEHILVLINNHNLLVPMTVISVPTFKYILFISYMRYLLFSCLICVIITIR